jgi:hypothetical protein
MIDDEKDAQTWDSHKKIKIEKIAAKIIVNITDYCVHSWHGKTFVEKNMVILKSIWSLVPAEHNHII